MSDQDKPQLTTLPMRGLYAAALAKASGDSKYGTGLRPDVTCQDHLDAAMRHIMEHVNTSPYDPESKCLHIGHAAARCIIAVDAFVRDIAGAESKPRRRMIPRRDATDAKISDAVREAINDMGVRCDD